MLPFPCGGAAAGPTPPFQIPIKENVPSSFDVTLGAYDASSTLIATAQRLGAPWGAGASVSFAANEWQTPSFVAFELDGVPAELDRGAIFLHYSPGLLDYGQASVPIANGRLASTLPVAAGANVAVQFSAGTSMGPAKSINVVTRVAAPVPPSIIATYGPVPITASAALDRTTGRVGWSASGGQANVVEVSLTSVTRMPSFGWSFKAPATRTELVIPALPANVDAPYISAAERVAVEYRRLDASSWDAIRVGGFGLKSESSTMSSTLLVTP
jgi:hypothetical protein